ncbi:hypothetical protein CBS101457_000784 [Exobasidium rhododendri]|nr:hypothetical protein CBS101457_000784 [Exobasidium rhododendri]
MMTASDQHQHHAFHPSDIDVLDVISSMPLRHNHSSDKNGFDLQPVKRNLDTLHALRRPTIDPIVLAASLSSGPHVTRHHFHHSFGPKVESKQMGRNQRLKKQEESCEMERSSSVGQYATRGRAGSYANCDREQRDDRQELTNGAVRQAIEILAEQTPYPSKQGPRSERLKREEIAREAAAAAAAAKNVPISKAVFASEKEENILPETSVRAHQELEEPIRNQIDSLPQGPKNVKHAEKQTLPPPPTSVPASAKQVAMTDLPNTPVLSSIVRPPPIQVRCYARTRIPTPHGEVFCHLYRNNRDNKEHLALVVDTAQNAAGGQWENTDEAQASTSQSIRSRTLDEVWGPHETEMERIVRGAYVGRLGPNYQVASKPSHTQSSPKAVTESPLVRIHSECFTGETIGSQRCDCGEQLDEAIRLIHADSQPAKGAVVYLRQEGRGIGLLDKLMAYNLQDMGHDTVSANILLGHLADARKYDVAAEILRDLGIGSCRLLTNNPDKMEALESERIRVEKRVAMIPRVWRHGHLRTRKTKKKSHLNKEWSRNLESSVVSQLDDGGHSQHHHLNNNDESGYSDDDSDASRESYVDHVLRRAGATMLGGSMTRGPELEKYLRTKVERMGHLLDVPPEQISMPRVNGRTEHSSPYLGSDDGYDVADAPLTDEEPHMDESELKAYVHANEGDDEDDEILISL